SDATEVNTFPDRPFTSNFSGNIVQICPVGALTATPYRFTARPWDLDQVESTCTTCALGCRVAVQSSANRLTRLLGLDSEPVNHGWLCDKGRYAFEAVNGDEVSAGPSDDNAQPVTLGSGRPSGQFAGEVAETASQVDRVTEPMVRDGDRHRQVGWTEALAEAATRLNAVRDRHGPQAISIIGGARATNEGAYAWTKLAKGVLGTDSVDAQPGDGLPAELVLGLPRATIDEACSARVLVTLSGDVREELPVLFLRLRRAILDGRTTLLELAPRATSLTRYAAVSLAVRPGDAPALARSLVGDPGGPPTHPAGPAVSATDLEAARRLVAGAGSGGAGIVVCFSRPSLAEAPEVTVAAVSALVTAWPEAKFLPMLRRGNVHGALDMGMAPGMLPGRTSLEDGGGWFRDHWGAVPEARGLGALESIASLAARDGRIRAVLLVGCDPLEDFPDRSLAERALANADTVIAVAGHPGPALDHADVVLPVAVAHERPGTTTNIEGRVTRLGQKLAPPGLAWPDWTIASALSDELGFDLAIGSVSDIADEIERVAPAYRGFAPGFLDQVSGHDGIVVPLGAAPVPAVEPIDPMAIPGVESVERQGAPPRVGLTESVSRELLAALHPDEVEDEPPLVRRPVAPRFELPAPDHYSLRLVSTRRLYDRGAAVDGSPSLARLVPTATAAAHPSELARLGVEPGDRVRVASPSGETTLAVSADAGVPKGVLAVDFNLSSDDRTVANAAALLIAADALVNEVRLESR
ncbi:MAG: molybdopterin oxidoreductase family protein, partial [Acidimicrobiales bacterium]